MKPIIFTMQLLFISSLLTSAAFADDECGAAVDAADSMNVNQKECDYSDKGLNGFLHKAFKKGNDGAVLETTDSNPSSLASAQEENIQRNSSASVKSYALTESKQPVKKAQGFSLEVEVDQWANLPVARAQLLPKALEKCGKGFSITGEHYRSLAMGRIELQLQFECDK